MATSIDEVVSFLSDEGLRYSHSEGNDYLRTGFTTKKYVDVDGDKLLHVVISVEEQGKFIKIAAPTAYRFHHDGTSFHKLALFQTLLQICHMTKMVQFEYDPDEGEIQAIVEFALEDADLTRQQLMRSVYSLSDALEEYHTAIHDAITGGIPLEKPSELRQNYERFLRERRDERLRQLGSDSSSDTDGAQPPL
jgi:hypothetical protein